MKRDYPKWHELKSELNDRDGLPTFQQQQVWWCNIGANIGHEEDGKNELFSRPVLVVKKYNRQLFLGVPLSTQVKENPYYYKINFRNKEQCALLSQIKVLDCKRLATLMGKLSDNEFTEVVDAVKNSF